MIYLSIYMYIYTYICMFVCMFIYTYMLIVRSSRTMSAYIWPESLYTWSETI